MKTLIATFILSILLASCSNSPEPAVSYHFNPDTECDEYFISTHDTKITVCQDLDVESNPAELIYNTATNTFVLEVKPVK